ncbi:uncharacterized protein LOC119837172 [Zerene cesonia]|uniref:uncharacterized protein LOC119837172 n=1 Tax=Zerene cesonia TaxID=33412 RepID=UPI0018E55C3E|nr:uncharacterized protein LOC119837172 [Zerene cesonia]
MACIKQEFVETMKDHIQKHPTHKAKWAKAIGRSGDMLHGKIPQFEGNEDCVPGKFYERLCQTCFCNDKKGLNCTGTCEERKSLKKSKYSYKKFPFKPEDVTNFDVIKHLSDKCVPGKMYRIACNGCLCREANNLLCENKLCVSHEALSRLDAKKRSGKQCNKDETRGCVQCKCVKNITKCKSIPKCEERERLSGNSHKMPLALNLQKEKCIPGMMYTVQCNQCYCQPDATLRCTQKACLNYAQVVKLHKQVTELEQQGL